MSDTGDRLRQIRESLGKSQETMAALLDTKHRTYQGYERGESPPKTSCLEQLSALGFSVDWLLTGQGAMRIDSTDHIRRLPKTRPGLSEAPAPAPAPPADRALLESCIVAAYEMAEEMRAEWPHEKTAKFALILYDNEQLARAEGRACLSGAEIIRLFRQVA